MRASSGDRLAAAASRAKRPLSSTPLSSRCVDSRQILDIAEEQRALARLLEQPGLPGASTPSSVAAALSSRSVRLSSTTNGPPARRPGLVDEARQLLAIGAGLAEQQQRRAVGGQPRQLAAQLRDRAAAADRAPRPDAPALTNLPLGRRERGIERALDGAQQLGQRQRLLDEIIGAEARGLDRGLDRAVAGHHHHRAGIARLRSTIRAAA